ncbi:Hypothetical_protein [Hexamita inflata]|uniref:Hypothetical_protein n=1 Tax=Hexamita inflata TaxID=28002 RepID=A0ABP1HQR9_9EUKA
MQSKLVNSVLDDRSKTKRNSLTSSLNFKQTDAFFDENSFRRAQSASTTYISARDLRQKFSAQLRKNYRRPDPLPVDVVNIHTCEHHCYRSYENIDDNYVYEQYNQNKLKETRFEKQVEQHFPNLFDYQTDRSASFRQKQLIMNERIKIYYYNQNPVPKQLKKQQTTPQALASPITKDNFKFSLKTETARSKSQSVLKIKTQSGKQFGISYKFQGW